MYVSASASFGLATPPLKCSFYSFFNKLAFDTKYK